MEKNKFLLLIIISLIILTGCSTKKNAISVKEFNEIAKSNNMEPQDGGKAYGYAEESSIINTSECRIFFYKIKRGFDLSGMYIDELNNMYGDAGITDDEETDQNNQDNQYAYQLTTKPIEKNFKKGKNWSAVEVDNNEKYYYIAMVDNTLLNVSCVKEKKEDVKRIIDAMKY